MDELSDQSARDRARGELKRSLVGNRWPPGTLLQEGELAKELGLSKTPVHEALLCLAERGLVRPVARVGYLVSDIALRDIAEVFAFRELLESQIVTEAASLRGVPSALPASGADNPIQRERAFHTALAATGATERVRTVLECLLDESERFMAYLDPERERVAMFLRDHDGILDAILAHDTMLSRALLTVHLTRIRESLMAILRQRLREQADLT